MHRFVVNALMLAGLAFLGCDSEKITEPFNGGYSLRLVNGTELPYLVSVDSNKRVYLRDELLVFAKDGTIQFISTIRTEDVKTGTATIQTITHAGQYRISGDGIEIESFGCSPVPECLDTGTIKVSEIVLQTNRYPSGPTLSFERAGEV